MRTFTLFLLQNMRAGVHASHMKHAATPLVMISDAGQDLDDEMAMILMRSLQDKGVVDCKGAVANLAPSRDRARLIRGTLDQLGLHEVPVATGTDGGFTKLAATFIETSGDYIAPDDDTFDNLSGIKLLKQVYESASDSSLELLLHFVVERCGRFFAISRRTFFGQNKDGDHHGRCLALRRESEQRRAAGPG